MFKLPKLRAVFVSGFWSLRLGDYLIIGAWNLGFNK
jgi:hypothetical protein